MLRPLSPLSPLVPGVPTAQQQQNALNGTKDVLIKIRDLMRELELPATALPQVLETYSIKLTMEIERDAAERERKLDAIRAKRAQRQGVIPQGDDFSHIAGIGYPVAMEQPPRLTRIPPGSVVGFTTDELDGKDDAAIDKIYRDEVGGK